MQFLLYLFSKVFADANITNITNTELRSKLEGYMEELSYEEKDEFPDILTIEFYMNSIVGDGVN